MLIALIAVGLVALLALLLNLAVMREAEILRGEVAALGQLITQPPVPPMLNETPPVEILDVVHAARSAVPQPVSYIAFLSDQCGACSVFTSELVDALSSGSLDSADVTCVIRAPRNSSMSTRLRGAGVAVLDDPDGKLLSDAGVKATPTIFRFEAESDTITDYSYGGGTSWILEQGRQYH